MFGFIYDFQGFLSILSGRNKEKCIYSILSGSRNPSPFPLKMTNSAICSIRGKKIMIGTQILDGFLIHCFRFDLKSKGNE